MANYRYPKIAKDTFMDSTAKEDQNGDGSTV